MDGSTFRVFYSWQSELANSTNRGMIRHALDAAGKKLEQEFASLKLHVYIDEATRDCPGSPNIPAKILEKIRSADAFVADITTINKDAKAEDRRTPNPNVVYELGYAVSYVGWDRVIMFFNEAFGTFPKDVPFDFDRYRISKYTADFSAVEKKKQAAMLETLAYDSLKLIYSKQPARPTDAEDMTPDKLKRSRDVRSLTRLLSVIHIPTLGEYISSGPGKVHSDIFDYFLQFNGIVTSKLSHFYDSKLAELVFRVHRAWNESLNYGHQYHNGASNCYYFFSNPGDLPLDDSQQKDWDSIKTALSELNVALDELLKHVREYYLEIDIEVTSNQAYKEHQ